MDHELYGFESYDQGQNVVNKRLSYGISAYDRASSWVISHTWQLPYGRGLRYGSAAGGIKKVLLAGWNFNGITTLQSGLPISPNQGDQSTLNADFGQRPYRIPGVSLYPANQSVQQWYNPAAFQRPSACCRYGDAARNSMRGPGVFTGDWSLWKEFRFKTPLGEDTALQFRWENFNIFNRANLWYPDNGIDSSTAGRIFDINPNIPMRRMQFGLRLAW
jgi:hypothetical protein